MISDLSLAKVQQIIYVQQGYRAVETGLGFEAANAVKMDHAHCNIGIWLLSGKGAQDYHHLPAYSEIEYPHEVVHKCMNLALHYLAQPWQTDRAIQARIIDNFKAIEMNSLLMNEKFDLLLGQKQQFEGSNSKEAGDI